MISSITVISIEVPTKMENPTDTVNIFGQMAVLTKDNLRMDFAMVKESGENQTNLTPKFMKDSSSTKKRKVTELLYGQMEVNISGISKMTYAKAMDKCIGRMETYTEDNGITVSKWKKYPSNKISTSNTTHQNNSQIQTQCIDNIQLRVRHIIQKISSSSNSLRNLIIPKYVN